MKLHLPARLRSALLACLAVVAPLTGTVATGCLVVGAAAVSLSVAHAAEITVNAGETVAYDSANTYVLNGGTLDVADAYVGTSITIGAADSTISLGSQAILSPLRVKLGEGVTSYKLSGTGTYNLASATDMYGANVSSTDWTGTVSIANRTGVNAFNINSYGNANSTVKVSGVAGWLALGVAFNPTLLLEDSADSSALNLTDGSTGREYSFSNVVGTGTFERGGTKFAASVTYSFRGDVSGWTGNFLNNYGQTSLVFKGSATEINLATITHSSGYAMELRLEGNSDTTVNTSILSTGEGTLKLVASAAGTVTFNKDVHASSLTAGNTAIAVGREAVMTVDGAADLGKTATVEGSLSLNGGGSLSNTIVNYGNVNLVGTFVVNSTLLDKTPTGDYTFTDGKNGYQESGSLQYTVVKNSSDATLNVQGAKLTFDGTPNVVLSNDGTVTAKVETQGTIYWVRDGEVSYTTTGAATYGMADGTLVLDKDDVTAQGSILAGLEGSQGTVKLTKSAKVVGGVSTKSAADLLITDGATLSIGDGKNSENYAGSFSSVTLDNGKIAINALPGAIQNLKVTENNGEISFPDYVNSPTAANAYVFSGVTQLDGQLVVKGSYKYVARFAQLKGAGSFEFNGPTSGEDRTQVLIDSLQGFTGNLYFVQNNAYNPYYKVTLNSGKADVSMTSLTVGKGADKPGNHNNIDMSLTLGGEMTLSGAFTMQSNAALSVAGATGLKLNGGLIVQGADNSISVKGDSAMDLGKLVVTDGAALSLSGKFSALAMNQSGTVNLTDMTLTDGASLVYGAGTSTLRVEEANLGASVKVDLNSLTKEQARDIAAGSGLDLGIDSRYAHSEENKTITVVSENIRDAKLDNSGDTWKLVSGVVSQYWEADGDGSGNWNTSDENWAFRDGATADSAFVGGTDAIFSGHNGATVTVAEQVNVQNLEIRSGYYTFEGDLVVNNDLVVKSDNNFFVGDVEVKGALRGEGYLGVSGDLKLGKSSEIGDLFMPSNTVTMTGTNTSSERNTDLTITGSATCNGLENVGKLTVTDGASMTVKSNTEIGSLAGAGKVEISNAKLTLTDGESSIGSLTANGLVLDETATLKVETLTVTDVTAKLGAAVVAGETILDVALSSSAIGMTVVVEQLDDLSKLTNGSAITLATVSQEGSVSGEWDISAIASESGVVSVSDIEFSVAKDNRGFSYELISSADNKTLTLHVSRDSGGWNGTAEDGIWSQNSAAEWINGLTPGDSQAAGFFGNGSSEVTIADEGVSTVLVDVDIEKGSTVESYTFTGGKVTAGGMAIGQGGLVIENETNVTGNTQVYTNGTLTVAGKGTFANTGDVSLTDDVSLTVQEGGDFFVGGTLSAEEAVTIKNAGEFEVGKVAIDGEIVNTDGTLQVLEGGSIGTVTGGKVELFEGKSDCSLEVGSMNVTSLAVSGGNSEVKLSEDSVIGKLTGAADAGVQRITSNAALTLEHADGGVNVSVEKALTLKSIGNVFGDLKVSEIILDLTGDETLSVSTAAVKANSLEKQQGTAVITLGFAADTYDSIPVDDENRMVTSVYKLISGVGSLTDRDFAIEESVKTEIARRGATAGFSVADDALLLSITAVPGGMIWDTAEGWVTNSGYEIPRGEGLYKALDYVEQVLVSDDTTIDLTAPGVGDADDMATIPAAGIIIRNPDGGGTLTLVGDPADDGILPDAATVIAKEEAGAPVTLIGKSMKVNIGLPEGTDGILTSDAASDKVVLAAAEMREGSALLVNRNTEVKGATELREGSSLIVADGAVLSTGKLEGETDATVTGRVNIESVGGIYHGSYGETGAEVEFTSGSYQTLRAGKGLSLRVAGGEGVLDLADADAEMSSLGIGSGFSGTAAKGSELVIRNATLNDEADRVEHHTLTLTESENVVSSSELTVSLGAAETAETLGTDDAPVIMDGSVRIDNSDICLKMETTKDNLRALDVNPNAPMIGAKLATLVTNGTVSADNEVEFVGDASLLNVVEKYYTNARLSADGDVLVDRVTDYYASKAGGMSETGSVGLEMLDKVLVELNPQTNTQDYQDLANVLNALDDAVVAGNTAEADKLAASVTGASAAALGAALAGDMERQLRAIRNRTTTMGVDQSTVNHNMPYFNAWINAEYDNRKLDEDGTLSGYDYSVTGGTVGFDVDVTPRFVCGLAVSALTGDMSSEGPDELEADVDSYYLTAFARTTYRRWTHTFVASVGKSDLSIDRTVSFSGGNYRTKGETDAMSFGFMYELGYVFALDADATTCLQPVLNVSVAHSSMDGYTESDSDAALEIGSVDMTTVTIGMGARLQSVVGQNIFNRASIFESRALIKVNAGDRDAEVDTALTALPTASGKVSSAERGPISLEIGAGITVPVGSRSGSIFLDGSAELGSEYTGVNATVGYRLNF